MSEGERDWEHDAMQMFVDHGHFGSPVVAWRRREPPACDFEIEFATGEIVGVELTDIAVRERIAGHAEANHVGRELQAALFRPGVPPCHITLSFPAAYADAHVPRGKRTAMVQAILGLAAVHCSSGQPERWYWRVAPPGSDEPVAPELQDSVFEPLCGVWICPAESAGMASHTTSIPGDDRSIVQSSIDKKNLRIGAYRSATPDRPVWLLVVNTPSRFVSITRVVIESHTFRSAFDRTYCLDVVAGLVSPIRTCLPRSE